jgi:hypothetical protein
MLQASCQQDLCCGCGVCRWFEEAPLPQRKELMPMFNPRKTE